MFDPVSSKPDLVAQEHEILALWRERRTFERLRAHTADEVAELGERLRSAYPDRPEIFSP